MQGQEAGEEDLLGFLGPMLPPDVAKGIAQGVDAVPVSVSARSMHAGGF